MDDDDYNALTSMLLAYSAALNDVNNVNVNQCIKSISGFSKLSDNKLTVARNVCTLIDVKSGFNNGEISEMINPIAVL